MKILKKCLKVLAVILLIAAAICIGLLIYDAAAMSGINSVSEFAFELPGYEDKKLVRQGIAFDDETETFVFSGYMVDKSTCPLYLRTADGEIRRVELLHSDGSVLNTHAGGVAICGDFIYLAGSVDDCLYVFSRDEVLSAPDGESVRSIGTFATALSEDDGIKPSFLTSSGGKVYVGEFHVPVIPLFRLRSNHNIGSTHALMAAFSSDPEMPLGLSETPCEAFCLPERVQGVAVGDDRIYLSRAFFLFPSDLGAYTQEPAGSMMLMGSDVPLYTLSETSSVTMPPFIEGIELVDGKLYISSETTILPNWLYWIWDGRECRAVSVEELR